MINATLNNLIIATLGKHYSKKIIPYLNTKEVFNEKGKPFSPSSIQNFVNGLRENLDVETEIINLVAETQQAKKDLINKKSKILKKQQQ